MKLSAVATILQFLQSVENALEVNIMLQHTFLGLSAIRLASAFFHFEPFRVHKRRPCGLSEPSRVHDNGSDRCCGSRSPFLS